MTNIAIFASGSGTNAEAIMHYFAHGPGRGKGIRVGLLASNNAAAGALERARRFGVPTLTFTREQFASPHGPLAQALAEHHIDFVVLAGFLWLVPPHLIARYRGRMVNIHPALLPRYGGKGMYGHHVHRAVAADRAPRSGITIHYVTPEYDKGSIIKQYYRTLRNHDPAQIEKVVRRLELKHFAPVIERVILA